MRATIAACQKGPRRSPAGGVISGTVCRIGQGVRAVSVEPVYHKVEDSGKDTPQQIRQLQVCRQGTDRIKPIDHQGDQRNQCQYPQEGEQIQVKSEKQDAPYEVEE